jgi:hypothetical protein
VLSTPGTTVLKTVNRIACPRTAKDEARSAIAQLNLLELDPRPEQQLDCIDLGLIF